MILGSLLLKRKETAAHGFVRRSFFIKQQMIAMGLSTSARQRNITFAADLAQIRAILEK